MSFLEILGAFTLFLLIVGALMWGVGLLKTEFTIEK